MNSYDIGKQAGWKEALQIFEKLYGIDMGQATKGAIDEISQQNNRRNHAVHRIGAAVQPEAVRGIQAQARHEVQETSQVRQREGGSMSKVQADGSRQTTEGSEEVSSRVLAHLNRTCRSVTGDRIAMVNPRFHSKSVAMMQQGYSIADEIRSCGINDEEQAVALMLLDMLNSFDTLVARRAAQVFLDETESEEHTPQSKEANDETV